MKFDSLQAHGLTRTVLALLFMAVLIATSFWILHLFITALLWAVMIVISTWSLMLKVQSKLRGSRALATTVMSLLLLLFLIGPFSLAIATVISNYEKITAWIYALASFSVPPPPQWIGTLPMVGATLVVKWQHLVEVGPAGISAFLSPYVGTALSWTATMSGSVGMMIVEFLLTVFIAAIFYMRGDAAAAWVSLFARRIAGQSGSDSLILAASAIRAVALGVVGTAIIQTFLAGLGLAACGVPAIAILVALIFMLELAQIGPMPVLIPVVIWLFWKEQMVMASFMAVWTLFLSVFDNIITPFLMKKGADLPMLLVFAGVTGGMLVFGVIGLFIGPVVLAVTYTLLDAWVTGEVAEDERASGTMKFVQQHVLLK